MKSLIQITFIIVLVSCGGGGGGSSSSPTIPDGSSSTGTSQSTVLQLDQILQLQQHLLQQLQQQAHITQTYQLLEQLPFLGILIQIN